MQRRILFLVIIASFIVCNMFVFSNAQGSSFQKKTIPIMNQGMTSLTNSKNNQKFIIVDRIRDNHQNLEHPPSKIPQSIFLGNNYLSKKPKLKIRTQKIKLKQPFLEPKRSREPSKLEPKGEIKKRVKNTQRRESAASTKLPIKKTKIAKIPKIISVPSLVKKKNASESLPISPKAQERKPVKTLQAPPPPVKVIKEFDKNLLKNQPAPKQLETPQQLAKLTSEIKKKDTAQSLIFNQGEAKLSNESKRILDSLSLTFTRKAKIRMQLLAYAGEPNLTASKARRLSLSRALAVRSYLIKKGVRSTRIDVRALGNKTSSGAPNRVELKIIKN